MKMLTLGEKWKIDGNDLCKHEDEIIAYYEAQQKLRDFPHRKDVDQAIFLSTCGTIGQMRLKDSDLIVALFRGFVDLDINTWGKIEYKGNTIKIFKGEDREKWQVECKALGLYIHTKEGVENED